MNAPLVVEDVIELLKRRYGAAQSFGRSRMLIFGTAFACSINYSKFLGGHKYFFGLSQEAADPNYAFPETELGSFVLLVCGSADNVLVLPRSLVLEKIRGVSTRRIDIFVENGAYILQTTKHPKLNVSEFLNAFPKPRRAEPERTEEASPVDTPDRTHAKMQWALIQLGRAEGCSVWVPPNDRNLSYKGQSFARSTLDWLPNFGFDENTRRIVQNIDVLWLTRNVIRNAFEVESTTLIYSGLLRLNDLILAQPNNQIDLHIVAARSKRDRVYNQLIRPSFQSLISRCEFVTFELVEEQVKRLEGFPLESGARMSGLIRGERFELPEHYIYPSGL